MSTTGWRAPSYSYAQAHTLARELGLSSTAAAVLIRRGFCDPRSAARFLEAEETHDPFEFRGMAEVAGLILDHVHRGSLIAVHGDYDVDGVCSTALAVRALRGLGANVRARLPSRMEDGYGLSAKTVEQLGAQGAGLLLTADCGIGAVEEVALARRLGIDVVVTDHHRSEVELPDCALVHPVVCGYPCAELCASGVVYKLAQALYSTAGRDPAELERELDIVALATVADVVPLLGENRRLVREGLRTLAGTARPGLRALMRVTGVEPQSVAEHTLGFVLGPRINAAGRLYRADAGLELMLTDDPRRALEIARELDAVNSERQAVETRTLLEAERQLSDLPERRDDPLHVLAGQGWHPGVIGIVASRLVERYHRPCVMVALDDCGHGRGSGRSISAYDLHAGLGACAKHLKRFGGHRMAAGLEIGASDVEPFRQQLVEHARSQLTEKDLVQIERVDAVVPGDAVALELAEELAGLRPFGMGNPAVNLLVPAAQLSDVRPMGEGRHARFTVTSAGVRSRAVAFGVGSGLGASRDDPELRHDLVARIEANEWQGAVEPRLVLRSLHTIEPACPSDENGVERGCADCSCGARGDEWWGAVWRVFGSDPEPDRFAGPARSARTVVDQRGRGIIGTLSDLLSTGESVLVVCADVSRRRDFLRRELDPARFGRSPASFMSVRCAGSALDRCAASLAEDVVVLADRWTIEQRPSLLGRFTHLFALDPPPFARTSALLRESAAEDGRPSFLHLGWGRPELDLQVKLLEHEYGLRAPLEAVYRVAAKGLTGEALERELRGEGRHSRSPVVVGRCLRILTELDLLEPARSSATVRCTTIKSERVDLERSESFLAYARLHQEALRFLGEQRQARKQAKAA